MNRSKVKGSSTKKPRSSKPAHGASAMTGGVVRSVERPFEKIKDGARVKRWITASLYPQTTATIPTTFAFSLNLLPGYTELTTAWDFYRITQVDILYEPASRAGSTAATGTAGAPHVFVRVNFDNSNSASYAQIQEYNNTRVYSLMQRWEHSFVPKLSPAAYNGVTTTGYTIAQGNPWVATANPDVVYYGLQYVTSQVTTGTQFGGTLFYRVHVEVKGGL